MSDEENHKTRVGSRSRLHIVASLQSLYYLTLYVRSVHTEFVSAFDTSPSKNV